MCNMDISHVMHVRGGVRTSSRARSSAKHDSISTRQVCWSERNDAVLVAMNGELLMSDRRARMSANGGRSRGSLPQHAVHPTNHHHHYAAPDSEAQYT